MKSDKTLNPIERARDLFNCAGLDLPPIPDELRHKFKERDEWCFSSRPVKMSPYEFGFYLKEAESKQVSDYVLLAHAGHGVNSYAIHYYLVRGPLRLFLQIGWGGVYMDRRESTMEVNQCFKLAGRLVELVEKKTKQNLSLDAPLMIVAEDFAGTCWLRHGTSEKDRHDGKSVREFLKFVLRSLAKK